MTNMNLFFEEFLFHLYIRDFFMKYVIFIISLLVGYYVFISPIIIINLYLHNFWTKWTVRSELCMFHDFIFNNDRLIKEKKRD